MMDTCSSIHQSFMFKLFVQGSKITVLDLVKIIRLLEDYFEPPPTYDEAYIMDFFFYALLLHVGGIFNSILPKLKKKYI